MVQSVLGSMTLGYRPLWNRARDLAGVQLFVHEGQNVQLDAQHLLRILEEVWTVSSPPLFLSVRSRPLLSSLLEQATVGGPIFEVPLEWLASDPALKRHVRVAGGNQVRMVCKGETGQSPPQELAQFFERRIYSLRSQDAVIALQAAAARRNGITNARQSPVQTGQIYEGVASRALATHCLDQQSAWALAGWPAEDVLHAWRYQSIQPSHKLVTQLLLALDTEQPMERLEQLLGEDAILVYRLLTYVNSAALGLRTGIGSIRHALMMVGVNSLKIWLTEQLPHASSDVDLMPVRAAMVLRARLTEHMMETGIEEDLRREVYLCGLFSQLDLLLGEPLATILHRLPLSDRIHSATVLGTGPYAGALLTAAALESPESGTPAQLAAAENEVDIEDVNRGLLRMLSSIRR